MNEELTREEKFEEILKKVMEKYHEVFKRLAEGPKEKEENDE